MITELVEGQYYRLYSFLPESPEMADYDGMIMFSALTALRAEQHHL